MKKKGNFVTDHMLDWIYILVVLVVILLGWLIFSGKLAGYVDAIGDLMRGRK